MDLLAAGLNILKYICPDKTTIKEFLIGVEKNMFYSGSHTINPKMHLHEMVAAIRQRYADGKIPIPPPFIRYVNSTKLLDLYCGDFGKIYNVIIGKNNKNLEKIGAKSKCFIAQFADYHVKAAGVKLIKELLEEQSVEKIN
jgi:hypothetical protein